MPQQLSVRIRQERIIEIKESGVCADCGQSYEHFCMDFDHVRGVKIGSISKLIYRSWTVIELELAKCDLVCVLCHRLREYKRRKTNPKPRLTDLSRRRGRRYDAVRNEVDARKMVPCSDCEKTYHHSQMEFDHRPGETKIANVCSLLKMMNLELVLAEVAKCDIVCALCHRRRTWRDHHYRRPKRQHIDITGYQPWRKYGIIKPEQEDLVLDLYINQRKPMNVVAKEMSVTLPTIRKFLDGRGVVRRSQSEGQMKLTPEQQDEVVCMYNKGISSPKIGTIFNVTEDVIRLCLKRRGARIVNRKPFKIKDNFGNIYNDQSSAARITGLTRRQVGLSVVNGKTYSGYSFSKV